jgi:hypothetical protein
MEKNIIKTIEWSPLWCAGSPEFQLYADNVNVVLKYLTEKEDTVEIKFSNVLAYKYESINDEVISGHPFCKKNLSLKEVNIIEHSTWLESIKTIHKIHPYFNENNWADYIHYFFVLKENTFEIICKKFEVTNP